MATIRTLTCTNCGASLATSAPAGATINCEYCGTALTVPEEAQPGPAEPTPAEPTPADATPAEPTPADATVIAGSLRRGMPASMPETGPGGEPPSTPEQPPAPDSPAGVGYTVDKDAVQPTVGRDEPPPDQPQIIEPLAKPSGEAPDAAEVIAEPTRFGAAVRAERGEPVLVPPARVVVTPPQAEPVGGPPGKAMTSRTPLIVAAVAVGCCLLVALGAVACVALYLIPIVQQ